MAQHRLWSIQTATLDLEMDRQDSKIRKEFGEQESGKCDERTRQAIAFKSLADESASLHLLNRYEPACALPTSAP
ncbi:MAG: hypothetical protein ACR2NN_11760 [Bryobacteraceae bacterium]